MFSPKSLKSNIVESSLQLSLQLRRGTINLDIYGIQFFVELPLAAELQPVEVPSGRPNIEKIENLNSKVH